MKDKQRFDLGVKYFNEEKYKRCFVTLYPLLTSEWQSYEPKEVIYKDAYYYVAVSILNGKLANTYKDTYNELHFKSMKSMKVMLWSIVMKIL